MDCFRIHLTTEERMGGTRRVERTDQASFRLDERPILSVHLVIESAGVAQVVPGTISTPQRRGRRAAVNALTTF